MKQCGAKLAYKMGHFMSQQKNGTVLSYTEHFLSCALESYGTMIKLSVCQTFLQIVVIFLGNIPHKTQLLKAHEVFT